MKFKDIDKLINFSFENNNGVCFNSKEFGILVNKMPVFHQPKINKEFIEIEGRNGSLTVNKHTYSDTILELECCIIMNETLKNYNVEVENSIIRLNNWLTDGGILKFSNSAFYRVVKDVEIQYSNENVSTLDFKIKFRCEPFRKLDDVIELKVGYNKIINESSLSANGLFDLKGNGDLELLVNNNLVRIKNIKDNIKINSETLECAENEENKNIDMIGEYPTLRVGVNEITTNMPGQLTITWNYL